MASSLVAFSDERIELDVIKHHYKTTLLALSDFYTSRNMYFLGYTQDELEEDFRKSVKELELNYCLSMLSSTEAKARMDYEFRASKRYKDDVSRAFRELYQKKKRKASLANDILEIWKEIGGCNKNVISELRSAIKYRNWLAHGRYWILKVGRRYDFDILNNVVTEFCTHMDKTKTP
jgi:hypothetical protein